MISPEDGAKIRALLANPERRTNKTARRYLLGGLLVCSHCGERLVARPRSGGKRRYACAKGPGFSGCGKTYINADDVERFVTEAVLIRLDSAALQRAIERRQRRAPDAQRWLSEMEQAQAQLVELAAAYGNREISMDELRAARKPIEQRLTNARKQLAQAIPLQRARPLRRQRRCAPCRLGRARPQPAARDRRRRRRSRRRRPGPARLQPLRRVAPDAGLAALSKQLRDLVERERVGELDGHVLVHAGAFDPRLRAGL